METTPYPFTRHPKTEHSHPGRSLRGAPRRFSQGALEHGGREGSLLPGEWGEGRGFCEQSLVTQQTRWSKLTEIAHEDTQARRSGEGFSKSKWQLSRNHTSRNSRARVRWQDSLELAQDLRKVYRAPQRPKLRVLSGMSSRGGVRTVTP